MEEIKDSMQRRIISIGILLIIFFSSMGLVFWRLIKDNDDLVRVIFVQVIAIVLFMVWVTEEGKIKFRKTPLNLPVLFYTGANALTLFITSNIYESLTTMLKLLIYGLIFLLAVNNLRAKDADRAFIMVVVMGLCMSAIGLLQYFGLDWFRFLYPAAPTGRVFSILGNPDFLGGYLALILPLALMLLINHGLTHREGIIGGISFFVILVCLLLTATRSALVAFGGSSVFLSVLLMLQKGMKALKKRWFYTFILFIAIFLALGFTGRGRVKDFFFRFSTLLKPETLKMDGAVQYRLSIWRTSLNMFKEHPVLGVGVGVFKLHYPLYQARLRSSNPEIPFSASQESRVHNEYLQTLSETGLTGIVAFIWLAFCTFFHGIRYLVHAKDSRQRGILIGLLSSILAMFLDSIFAFPFHLTSHATLFWIFLGMLVVRGEDENSQSIEPESGSPDKSRPSKSKPKYKTAFRQRQWGLIISVWVLSIVLIVLILRSFFGTVYYKQAIIYGNQHRDEEAIESYLKAIKLSPYDPEVHFTWGYVCLNSNRVEEAFKEFQLVERLYPHNEDNLLNLGVVYNLERKPEKAIEYFKKAIMLNPRIGAAYFNIAGIFMNYYSNSPWAMEEALRYCRKAVELEPGNTYYQEILKKLTGGKE